MFSLYSPRTRAISFVAAHCAMSWPVSALAIRAGNWSGVQANTGQFIAAKACQSGPVGGYQPLHTADQSPLLVPRFGKSARYGFMTPTEARPVLTFVDVFMTLSPDHLH